MSYLSVDGIDISSNFVCSGFESPHIVPIYEIFFTKGEKPFLQTQKYVAEKYH
ncbi:MAG: hypothetical protein ACE5FF_09705 [Saprospiraceae bacterium]